MVGQLTLGGWAHERAFAGKTDEWITPRWILSALGEFDLDPAASVRQPWPCAKKHYTEVENGLAREWRGRVWLNPPYGSWTKVWLARAAEHRDAVALVFARTEVSWFQREIFGKAQGLLFLRGRVAFHRPDGSLAPSATSGSVLVAYGGGNVEALRRSGLNGCFLELPRR